MSIDHTRKYLRIQGFDLDDETLCEVGPWMRWPYVLCAGLLIVALTLGSVTMLWLLTAVALSGAILPSHLFTYVYNHGFRHLTGTRPLPRSTPQGRFACGMGGTWLVAADIAFAVGAPTVGTVLGWLIAPVVVLVAATHVCIPSMIFNALFDRDRAAASD